MNITGSLIRADDHKDIEILLLEKGFAHVREDVLGTILAKNYEELELKAKEKHKGIFKKEIGTNRYEDFTKIITAKKDPVSYENKYQFFNKIKECEEAVL